MENAIITFTYGLTLGVTAVIILQFILDEYYSLKKQKSWPTAESTQEEENQDEPILDEKNQKDELGDTILHEEESDFNDHQYQDLIKKK